MLSTSCKKLLVLAFFFSSISVLCEIILLCSTLYLLTLQQLVFDYALEYII